jgi:hypothetical protein
MAMIGSRRRRSVSVAATDPPGWLEFKAHFCSDEKPPAHSDKIKIATHTQRFISASNDALRSCV